MTHAAIYIVPIISGFISSLKPFRKHKSDITMLITTEALYIKRFIYMRYIYIIYYMIYIQYVFRI